MSWWDVAADYLVALFRTARQALLGNPDALQMDATLAWTVPLGIAAVAGASMMIGQSLVLAINRVDRRRGVLTMVAACLGSVAVALLETALVWSLARLVVDESRPIVELLPVVLVAFAPYWLGFLVLLPYTGPGIARVLQIWHVIVLWRLLSPVLGTDQGAALLIVAGAWLATVVLDFAAEHSPLRLRERLFRLLTGSNRTTARDLMAAACPPVVPR